MKKQVEDLINSIAFLPVKGGIVKEELPEEVQEVYIVTNDGVKLHNYFIPQAKSKKLLIYFHGNAGHIGDRLDDLRKLAGFDVSIIGVSYRGYGKSEGSASEEGVYTDGRSVYKYAVEKLGFKEEDIFLLGRSIGSIVATEVARGKQLAGLILVTPMTNLKELAIEMGMGAMAHLVERRFDNLSKITEIKAPLLLIHGDRDEIIPYSMGQAIAQKAPTLKGLVTIKNGTHNDLSGYEEYWKSLKIFL